jgi:ribosomal protein L11 methylase PrmA
MTVAHSSVYLEPGSFRDPTGGVLRKGQRVWRYFDSAAAAEFKRLAASGVLERLAAAGKILSYSELGDSELAETKTVVPRAAHVIEQPLLPFISYAYEWPFEMLKDAALLHLDVLEELLKFGFILKDGSTDNIQFAGTRPLFIDLGSIEPYTEGNVWAGYNQFCRMFLNPLLLEAGADVPFQKWLRSAPQGILAEEVYRILSWPARFHRSTFVNVTLQAWLNNLFDSRSDIAVRDEKRFPVNQRSLIRQVQSLRRIIDRLKGSERRSFWSDYDPSESYSSGACQSKTMFVESQLSFRSPRMVWDCGCNTGDYSLLAARHADVVVALDADPVVINKLYVRARAIHANVLPLVVEMTNPSPDQGWGQVERYGLERRGPADMVLWLALLHHVALTGGIPPDRQIAWIARTANRAIIEFIPRTDPKARALSQWRPTNREESCYSREVIEEALQKHFTSVELADLPGSERILYSASKL